MKGTKQVIISLIAVCMLLALGNSIVLPVSADGSSMAKAAAKEKETKPKKNAKDAAALKKIIKAQVKSGATISRDLDNSSYIWGKKGRLEGINWGGAYGLTGSISLSAFSELKTFNCYSNKKISKLDVSKNKKLVSLSCADNQLTKLDVSKNTKLTSLLCGMNKLTSLDIGKNTKLTNLSCVYNKLKTLKIGKNTKLILLNCKGNELTQMNLKACVNLQKLYCEINELKKLDLSGNKNLSFIDCSCNKLKELNLSQNKNLTSLTCPTNLFTKLDVSKNKKLQTLECDQDITVSGAPKTCNISLM